MSKLKKTIAKFDLTNSKRFIEALTKGEKKCRECSHKYYEHLTDKCFAVFGNEENLRICKCKEFVPSDNLDYVEWLAKKRGLVE